jgi:lipopolysaccharide transport system permease protein
LTLGLSWFLASAGVFLRDIRQFIGVAVTMLMFLSPIFYPASAIPEALRTLLMFNPMTPILEQGRDLLFWGRLPDWGLWLMSLVLSYAVAWLGYAWFVKTRKGFADVV